MWKSIKYHNVNITRDKGEKKEIKYLKNTMCTTEIYRWWRVISLTWNTQNQNAKHDTYPTWVPETSVCDSAGLPHKTPKEQILSTENTLKSWKPSLHIVKCLITSQMWFLEYLNKLKPFSQTGVNVGDYRLTLTMVLTYSDSTAQ